MFSALHLIWHLRSLALQPDREANVGGFTVNFSSASIAMNRRENNVKLSPPDMDHSNKQSNPYKPPPLPFMSCICLWSMSGGAKSFWPPSSPSWSCVMATSNLVEAHHLITSQTFDDMDVICQMGILTVKIYRDHHPDMQLEPGRSPCVEVDSMDTQYRQALGSQQCYTLDQRA